MKLLLQISHLIQLSQRIACATNCAENLFFFFFVISSKPAVHLKNTVKSSKSLSLRMNAIWGNRSHLEASLVKKKSSQPEFHKEKYSYLPQISQPRDNALNRLVYSSSNFLCIYLRMNRICHIYRLDLPPFCPQSIFILLFHEVSGS